MGFMANQKRAIRISKFNNAYKELSNKGFKMLRAVTQAPDIQKHELKDIEPDELGVFCLLCSAYFLCEDYERHANDVKDEYKPQVERFAKYFETSADKLFEVRAIRAFYMALIEYKNDVLTELLDAEWTATPEAERVRARLEKYGNTNDAELYEEYAGYKELMAKL